MQQPGRGAYPPHTYPGPQQQQINIRSLFPGAVFHHPFQFQGKPAATHIVNPHLPVHPDVKLKKLPFYEVSTELIKPSTLIPQGSQRQQDNTFVFHLTPQQATMIGMSRDMRPGSKVEYAVQVQLRFCVLETSCEQDDCFPPGIMVKVNNKLCQLPNPIPTNKPGVEPRRPPRPVNITPLIKISPTVGNTVHIQWMAEYGRGYVAAVYLVHKKTSEDLLNRLKAKGVRGSDFTRGMIQDKLNEDADSEIATTSLRVSLVCPLGKMRMTTPCRASTCQHLQCFDASLYLQMNERKPTWMCPVCDKPALYDKLVIDGYFQEVLNSEMLTEDINEIQLHRDGSWSFLVCQRDVAPDPEENTPSVSEQGIEIEIDADLAAQIAAAAEAAAGAPSTAAPDEPSESEQGFEIEIDPDLAAQIAAAAEAAVAAGEDSQIQNLDDGEIEQVRKKKKEEIIDLTLSDSDDDEPAIPVKKTIMEPLHHFIRFTEAKKTATACRASAAVLNTGNESPSLIILDSDSPPGTPGPLITVATTSTMLAPAATVTVTAAAAAAAAAKAKAAATALAAAKAMATAMATATATATLTQAQTSASSLTPALTQTLAPGLGPGLAPALGQTLAPGLSQALAPALGQTLAPNLAPALALANQTPRLPPPPYNAVVSYIQQPCHFLDIDGNAAFQRF